MSIPRGVDNRSLKIGALIAVKVIAFLVYSVWTGYQIEELRTRQNDLLKAFTVLKEDQEMTILALRVLWKARHNDVVDLK